MGTGGEGEGRRGRGRGGPTPVRNVVTKSRESEIRESNRSRNNQVSRYRSMSNLTTVGPTFAYMV